MAIRNTRLGGTNWTLEHPTFQDLNDTNDGILDYVDSEITIIDNKIDDAIDNIKTPELRLIIGSLSDGTNISSQGGDYDIENTFSYTIPSSYLSDLKTKFDFVLVGQWEINGFLRKKNNSNIAQMFVALDIGIQGQSRLNTSDKIIQDLNLPNEESDLYIGGSWYLPLRLTQAQLDNGFIVEITSIGRANLSANALVGVHSNRVRELSLIAIPKRETTNYGDL